MNEKREFQNPVSISELAAQKEATDQDKYSEILGKLQVTGGSLTHQETTEAEILSLRQEEIQAVSGIQVLTKPIFVNYSKKDAQDSKTWKDKTDKRKSDKSSRRV